LVWLTFSGTVVASYRHRHIGFEVIVDRLQPGTRRIVDFIGESFVLFFQGVLLYYGWLLTRKMGDETAVSLVWVKMSWIYSVLPIAGGLMFLISVKRLVDIVVIGEANRGDAAWSGSSSE
jgi:TRAP-type C4-dicarboxylate transport system permease small subunit